MLQGLPNSVKKLKKNFARAFITRPLLRSPAPAPYFHPFFKFFRFPSPGDVIKIYSPPY